MAVRQALAPRRHGWWHAGSGPALSSPIDGERWERLKVIVSEALDQKPEEREAWLAAACAGDEELQATALRLLARQPDADAMEVPASAALGLDDEAGEARDPLLGARLGPWRLDRRIGQGGMGSVYSAHRDDGAFSQVVAVKVMRFGLDTDELHRRFRTERQILAGLAHPYIARLLDGGSLDDGRPYLVMEQVEGRPIDKHCEERGLSVRDRLSLFLKVCEGVHYAHQRLIVHRDLKPANVLVNAEGVPKLLDFGIAKLLAPEPGDEANPATATGVRLMTPDYASPEQMRGEPVSTAADVYALGVMLYKLLSGKRPFVTAGRDAAEIVEVVSRTTPVAPSAMGAERDRAALRGDLDTIVLMALRKEPERRYGSVEQLAADVRRHLEGQPVLARRDTFGYRASRFVRRHRLALSAAFLLIASLAGGIVSTYRQAQAARAERDRAERRFADLRALARALVFDIDEEIAPLRGATRAREKLVTHALTYLDGLSREADDPDLQVELGVAYHKVADAQGNPYAASLGQYAAARKSYERSRDVLERVVALPGLPRPEALAALSRTYRGLGDVVWQLDEVAAGQALYQRSTETWDRLAAVRPLALDEARSAAWSLSRTGDVLGNPRYTNLGRTEDGLAAHRRALQVRQALLRQNPGVEDLEHDLFDSESKVALFENALGRAADAAASASRAVAIAERLAARQPDSSVRQNELAFAYMVAAQPHGEVGQYQEAEALLEKSIAVMQRQATTDPSSGTYPRNLGILWGQLSDVRSEAGRHREAVAAALRGLPFAERPWRAHPQGAEVDHARALGRAASAHLGAGDPRAAALHARRALEVLEPLDADALPPVARLEASLQAQLGRALVAEGSRRAGVTRLQEAQAVLARLSAANPKDAALRDELAWTTFRLAEAAEAEPQIACPALQASVTAWSALRAEARLRLHSSRALRTAEEKAARCGPKAAAE